MADSPFTGESIPDLLRARVEASPDVEAYWHEVDGKWHPTTWRQFSEKVNRLAAGLVSKGLTPGTHVGLLFPTSLEWEVAHHAVLRAGGVVVGLEPHDTAERLHWIIGHADVEILIVQHRALYDKIAGHGELDLRMVVFVTNETVQADASEATIPELLAHEADEVTLPSVHHEAAATIIYTSGTTGQPKGILYRHEQVVLAIKAITRAYPTIAVGSRFVCWLPLSNLFQRIMNLAAMQVGGTVYLVRNPLDVMKALTVAKPDIFIGVPRFYEKLHEGMQKEIDRKPVALRWLIRKSIDLALSVSRARCDGRAVPLGTARFLRLADRLVLSKLRESMGGRIQFMITGSAPTPVRLLEFFLAIGLPLYEAYGMSENVVPMALNSPTARRIGTVGRVLPENEVRLNTEGTLQVRGRGVFGGYYKEDRNALFTPDGFYTTGDRAEFQVDRFLRLLGRNSDLIKTSTGRRIAPGPIEAKLESIPGVDRAVVLGSGRKCVCAILSMPSAPEFSSTHFSVAATKALQDLPEYERPGVYVIRRKAFSIEAGELTTNLKLRRHAIASNLETVIEALYDELAQRDTAVVSPLIRPVDAFALPLEQPPSRRESLHHPLEKSNPRPRPPNSPLI
jgi:long-chain acyl-CoA synthetase